MLISFALFKIFHLQPFTWPQLPQKTLPQLSLHPDCGCGSPASPFWFHQTFLRCPETDPCDGGRDVSELEWTDRRYKVGRTILKLLHSPSWCKVQNHSFSSSFDCTHCVQLWHVKLQKVRTDYGISLLFWGAGCCGNPHLMHQTWGLSVLGCSSRSTLLSPGCWTVPGWNAAGSEQYSFPFLQDWCTIQSRGRFQCLNRALWLNPGWGFSRCGYKGAAVLDPQSKRVFANHHRTGCTRQQLTHEDWQLWSLILQGQELSITQIWAKALGPLQIWAKAPGPLALGLVDTSFWEGQRASWHDYALANISAWARWCWLLPTSQCETGCLQEGWRSSQRRREEGNESSVWWGSTCANFKCLLVPAGLVCCSLNRAANFQIDTYSNPIPEGAIMVHSVMGYYLGLLQGGKRMKGGGTFLEKHTDVGTNQHHDAPSTICKAIRLL